MLPTVRPKNNRMLAIKIYAKSYISFCGREHCQHWTTWTWTFDGSFRTGYVHDVMSSYTYWGKNKIGKQQCLPNLRRQLLLQDKHPNNYCIFKYIMIVPTSAFQKIYNRRTLGLLLRCLKWALGPGEKKKQREISISAQFVHARFTRKMYILYKFKVPNFIQNCKSLTWSTPYSQTWIDRSRGPKDLFKYSFSESLFLIL